MNTARNNERITMPNLPDKLYVRWEAVDDETPYLLAFPYAAAAAEDLIAIDDEHGETIAVYERSGTVRLTSKLSEKPE